MARTDRAALAALAAGALAACFRPAPWQPLSAAALERDLPRVPGPGGPAPDRDAAAPASWDLDLHAAIAYAARHAPALGERRDLEAIADARIAAAGQLTNPELHLGQSSQDDLLVGPTARLVVALRVFPDLPWAIDARVAQARATLAAERAITTTAARALTAQVKQRYAQLAFGDATRAVLDQERAVMAERRRVLGEQLRRSAATRLEVVFADQDAAEIEAQITGIDVAMTRARGELAALLGIPPGQAWRPVWNLDAEREIHSGLDRAALADRALARPELAELAARAEAAEAAASEQRTRRLPWLQSLQVERSVRDQVEWAASATISLPLLSWNSGGVAAAEAERRRYADQRHRLALATVRQVDDAIALVEATGARSRELRDQLAPAGSELAQLFAAEKAAAVADPVKLLLLEERHVRAQRAMLDAACDHRLAWIALEALTESPR